MLSLSSVVEQLDHPHLVRLKRVYLSPPRVYIVTELLTGGELLDALTVCGKYPEPDARRMMEQLLQAVDYLHSHGIAHRSVTGRAGLLIGMQGVRQQSLGSPHKRSRPRKRRESLSLVGNCASSFDLRVRFSRSPKDRLWAK